MIQRILLRGCLILAGLAIIYLSVVNAQLKHAKAKEVAAAQKVVDAVAEQLVAVKAQVTTASGIIDALKARNSGLTRVIEEFQKADKRAKPVQAATNTVEVKDVVKGAVQTPNSGPSSWEDEYHRFHLELPNGPLTRRQLFHFDAVVIRGVDGSHRFYKSEFREFDPVTKDEIPVSGVVAQSTFQWVDEALPAVSPFHPIVVFAADSAGIGGGVEFARWKQLHISALGFYDRAAKGARGAVQLGYRLKFPFLDSNVSLGISYSTDGKIRPGATVALTR